MPALATSTAVTTKLFGVATEVRSEGATACDDHQRVGAGGAPDLLARAHSHVGDQVVHLIREEMRSRGTAAIIVTHDDRSIHYAARTVRIAEGRISDAAASLDSV